jgi:TRAP-type C4-dicarboxylate transport system permease small subunit
MSPSANSEKKRPLGRAGRFFINTLSIAAVCVLVAMMLLTTADVVARYILNSPINGAFEMTEVLLAALIFLAMPLTTKTDGHIRVDLIKLRQDRLLSKALTVAATLFVAVIFALTFLEVFQHALKLQKWGTVTNALSFPLYLVAGLVAVSCAICAICALAMSSENQEND